MASKKARAQFQHQQPQGELAVQAAHPQVLARPEAVPAVVVRIAQDQDGGIPLPHHQRLGVLDQRRAHAPPLPGRVHAQRPEGGGLHLFAQFVDDPGTGEQDAADDLPLHLGHAGQFRQEVFVASHHVDEVMLIATGLVQVPERFARQRLDGGVVGLGFRPDANVRGTAPAFSPGPLPPPAAAPGTAPAPRPATA